MVNLKQNQGEIRTWFILAVHPAFLPDGLCPDIHEQQEDRLRHPLARRWDCLAHGLQVNNSRGSRKVPDALPDVSRPGLFINSPHAELAHFLVVRRMLARFPKVHICMDGDKSLWTAALTAFSGDVRSGRVEIALFQHSKKAPKAGARTGGKTELKRRAQSLEAARRDMQSWSSTGRTRQPSASIVWMAASVSKGDVMVDRKACPHTRCRRMKRVAP